MQEVLEEPRRGITRRGLLKTGLAAGAAAMVSSSLWLKEEPCGAQASERVAFTYHKTHCGGMCPLKCTVRDGRMVLVEPNHCADDRYETICLKGISEVQHVYSDHRIQSPLKRVGERGEGEFVQITWDEALDTVAETVKELIAKYGAGSVCMGQGDDANNMPWLSGILGAPMDYDYGIDVGIGNGFDPATGYGAGYMGAMNEARDWVNSQLVLMVGTNFLESNLPVARQFFEAQDAGCEIVVVDPHFSTTAGKADQWIPIEPGTDATLFMAMSQHILASDLCDWQFVRDHTSLPFLVDTETGALLRQHPVDLAALEPESGEQNPFYVWDGTSAVSYLTCENPVLDAGLEVDGRPCATVLHLLKQSLEGCSPAWAEGICGVPEAVIRSLAEKYAAGPSCLALGWGGGDKLGNADIAGHAAAVLVALTGNIAKVGAGAGSYIEANFNGHQAMLGGWDVPEELLEQFAELPLHMDRNERVYKGLICNVDTLHQHMANMNKTAEWAKQLEFIVTIDPYFTEGAKWADIILPCATRFELEEEIGNVKPGYNSIVVQNRVLEPLFESHSDFWIQKELAKRFGVDQYLPETAEDFARSVLATSPDPAIAQLTIEAINECNGVFPLPGIEEPRRDLMDRVFPTASGRMELYYENMVPFGQQLPSWEAPLEVYDQNPMRSTYPLQLVNVRTRFRIHNQFNDAKWIQPLGEARVELNPADLEARGLSNEEVVRVFNDRGEFSVKVRGNQSVRPGVARIFEGQSADFMVSGNVQNVTNDAFPERAAALLCGPVIPFSDTLVQVEKA